VKMECRLLNKEEIKMSRTKRKRMEARNRAKTLALESGYYKYWVNELRLFMNGRFFLF